MLQINQTIGNYRIRGILGEGGMGIVYEAEDVELQRFVAIKVMRDETAKVPGAKDRFLREARAMASIKSDHIVTIYQVGVENNRPFFVMELLEGRPLNDYLTSGRRLTWKQVLRLARELAQGLYDAHRQGLIHRDIKPANIFVELPRGRVKILDFGLARPTEQATQLTKSGAVLGTPHYMAPEQASGKRIDERADLFSLGVILYQMATGDLPFQGESIYEVLMAIGMHNPAPIRSICPETPHSLSNLIHSLLEKERENRPRNASELLTELDGIDGIDSNAGYAPASVPRGRHDTTVNPRTPRISRESIPRKSNAKWGLFLGVSITLICLLLGAIIWLLIDRGRGGPVVVNNGDPKQQQNGEPEKKYEITHGSFPANPQIGDSVTNSIGMKLMWIPPGEFDMGTPGAGAVDDETPCKRRKISRGFWFGAFEVTQKEYRAVMGNNPSTVQGDDLPVTDLSYEDCLKFCVKMKEKTGLDYRLPTEAQWEYAARAGTRTAYSFGDDEDDLEFYGWFDENSDDKLHPIGRKRANPWGLYDIYGNAEEWCLDWYLEDFYKDAPTDDPLCDIGPKTDRVRRGGSFTDAIDDCRSATRYQSDPMLRADNLGFRVVIVR
jgi:serine/threonine protein kinase